MCPGGIRAEESLEIVSFHASFDTNFVEVKMGIDQISLRGQSFIHPGVVSMLLGMNAIAWIKENYGTPGFKIQERRGGRQGGGGPER